MKNINNYIFEKLHISKNLKTNFDLLQDILDNTLLSMYFENTNVSDAHKAGIINFLKIWIKDNDLDDKGVLYYTHPGDITLMVKNKVSKDIIGNMKEPDDNIWPASTEPQWDTSNIYIGTTKPKNGNSGKLKVSYKGIIIVVVANEDNK